MRPLLLLLFFCFPVAGQSIQEGDESSPEPLGKVLSYPNCRITIFFEEPVLRVAGGIWLQKGKIDRATRVSVCGTIENVFDQMPPKFRAEFDKTDIYLVHTNKESMYNWHQNRDIYLEASRIRPELSDSSSYFISLLSELGYQIAHKYKDTPDMASLISYFKSYRLKYRTGIKIKDQESAYPLGFINKLSFANNNAVYDPKVEFGELFAHMLCPETHGDLMAFIADHPQSYLSDKVTQLSYTVRKLFPDFNRFPEVMDLNNEILDDFKQNELLAKHELKAFETSMAKVTGDDREIESTPQIETIEFASLEKEFVQQANHPIENISSEQEYIALENNKVKHVNKNSPSTQAKKKKKGGWIVVGVILLSIALAGD